MYPSVSLGMIFLITIFLLIFIVPIFKDMFDKIGRDLPLPTRVVLYISESMQEYWYICLAGMIGVGVLWTMVKKAPRGRYLLDKAKIRAAFGIDIPHWRDSLEKTVNEIIKV